MSAVLALQSRWSRRILTWPYSGKRCGALISNRADACNSCPPEGQHSSASSKASTKYIQHTYQFLQQCIPIGKCSARLELLAVQTRLALASSGWVVRLALVRSRRGCTSNNAGGYHRRLSCLFPSLQRSGPTNAPETYGSVGWFKVLWRRLDAVAIVTVVGASIHNCLPAGQQHRHLLSKQLCTSKL